MTFERINPENLAAPIGFSHAVAVEGKRIVFLAGQTSMEKSGAIVGNGIVEQFERALSNLLISLKESIKKKQFLLFLIHSTNMQWQISEECFLI